MGLEVVPEKIIGGNGRQARRPKTAVRTVGGFGKGDGVNGISTSPIKDKESKEDKEKGE